MGRRHGILLFLLNIILASSFSEASGSTISTIRTVPGRNLLQMDNGSQPLAQDDDTVRVDPLDHFKKYRGGYDITNKHYWSSIIFTGIFGYAIGMAWLLIGVLYGGFLLASHFFSCNCNANSKKRSHCFKQCFLWPVLLAIFLTILALTASGLFLGGNARFHSRANTVVKIIINTADEASETIYNATGAMKGMTDNLGFSELGNVTSSDGVSVFLTSTSQRLDGEAAEIHRQARKNRRRINKGLDIVFVTTTVVISLNVVAVIALFACGTFKLNKALHWLIVLCWILTTLCWFFSGAYFFLEKFSKDTCNAFQNFQKNPYNNTLSSILPCDELLSAKPVLSDVSEGIYSLVNQVNANISILQATTFPNLASVCNPFSGPPEFQYQPNNCPANTIKISDIPQILKEFACSDTTTCSNGEFISFNDYKRVETYTNLVQQILNSYSGMQDLVECESVKDAFTEILGNHCRPLKRYARMAWAVMVALSVIMVALVSLWTFQARHEHQVHSSDGSVNPNSARMAHVSESTSEIAI